MYEMGETSVWRSEKLDNVKSGCVEKSFTEIGVFSFETEFLDDSFSLKFFNDVQVIEKEELTSDLILKSGDIYANFEFLQKPTDNICYSEANSNNFISRNYESTVVIDSWTSSNSFTQDEIELTIESTVFTQSSCIFVSLKNSQIPCNFRSLQNNIYKCFITLNDAENYNLVPYQKYMIQVLTVDKGYAIFTENNEFWFEPQITSITPAVGSINGGTIVTVSGEGVGFEDATVKFNSKNLNIDRNSSNYNTLIFETVSNPAENVIFEITVNNIVIEMNYEYSEDATVQLESVQHSNSEIQISTINLPQNYNFEQIEINLINKNQPIIENPESWTYFSDLRSYYRKIDGNSWQKVIDACKTLHSMSKMIEPRSMAEVDAIQSVNADSGISHNLLVGLYRESHRNWRWASDNSLFFSSEQGTDGMSWSNGSPDYNNPDKNRAFLQVSWLTAETSSQPRGGMCEIKLEPEEVVSCQVTEINQNFITCIPTKNLNIGDYRLEASFESIGKSNDLEFTVSEDTFKSYNLESKISSLGQAKFEFSMNGGCGENCVPKVTFTKADGVDFYTGVTWLEKTVFEAKQISETEFVVNLDVTINPYSHGLYNISVTSNYGDIGQILQTEVVYRPSLSIDSESNLSGGEIITFSDLSDENNFCNNDDTVLILENGAVNGEGAVNCEDNTITLPSLPTGFYSSKFRSQKHGDFHINSPASFTYPLTVTEVKELTTKSIGGGNILTITGQGFDELTTQIQVCGVNCEIIKNSLHNENNEETIECLTGKIDTLVDTFCDVVVFPGIPGPVTIENAVELKIDETPVLSSISKTRGGSAGGSIITLSGSGFFTQPQVKIGGNECIVSSFKDNEIICVTEADEFKLPSSVPEIIIPGVGATWYDSTKENDLKFRYVDLWSSSFTWGCSDDSCLPKTGEIIVVEEGQHLVLDVDSPLIKALIVMGGTFEIDREILAESVTLSAEYIIVTQNGHFMVGTEENPYPCDKIAEIVLFGHRRSIQLPMFGSKVLGVRTGKLDLHGCRKEHTWTVLESTVEAGSDRISLKHAVDWNVGEEIVIATTGGHQSQHQSERRKIKEINGTEIILNEILEYQHLGREFEFVSYNGESRTLSQRAEVGVLTRNLKVRGNINEEWLRHIPACESVTTGLEEEQTCFEGEHGADIGSDQFGSQIMLQYPEYGKIEFIEVSNGGQSFSLGRYPLHFHLSGDQPDSYIRGCGIHDTFNRATTIHATNFLTVEFNVAYNIMGLTIFIEDGNEENNVIQYNLAMFTRSSAALLNVDQTPAAFWVTNPKNIIRHNVAAGASHIGFWYNPPQHPTGPSFDPDYCPRNQIIQEFRNNTAHSCGIFGLWVFEEYQASFNGECFDKLEGGAGKVENYGNFTFDEFYAWGNERGAEITAGAGINFNKILAGGNKIAQISVMDTFGPKTEYEWGVKILDSIAVGYLNDKNDEIWGRDGSHGGALGIETAWQVSTFYVDGLSIHNMGTKGAGVDLCYSSYQLDCLNTQWFKNMYWGNDVISKTKFDWEHEAQIIDIDGSYTGRGRPSIVLPKTNLVPNNNLCEEAPESSFNFPAIYCDYPEVYMIRVSFNNPDPESLTGIPALIENFYGSSNFEWRQKRSTHTKGWGGFMLADTLNKISFEGIQLNHTFTGEARYLKPDVFLKVQSDIEAGFDRMEWGSDVNTGENRIVAHNPSVSDVSGSYHLETQTAIFHNFGENDVRLKDQAMSFRYRAYLPAIETNDTVVVDEIKECNWSDSECWEWGVVPGAGDIATVQAGVIMTVDVEMIELDYLYVMGVLKFDESMNHEIRVKGIQVNGDRGYIVSNRNSRSFRSVQGSDELEPEIIIGSPNNPYPCDKTVKIILTDSENKLIPGYNSGLPIGAKAIAVFGGLKMYGCEVHTARAILKQNAEKGQKFIRLQEAPVGWEVGGKIVIGSSGVMYDEHDVAIITNINGNRVDFDEELKFKHLGKLNTEQTYQNGDVLNKGVEVIYQSRNIKISSEIEQTSSSESFGLGGRVLVGRRGKFENEDKDKYGHAQLSNVEFTNMGQFGYSSSTDPRDQIVFYNTAGKTGDFVRSVSNDSFVKNCVFDSGYWTAIGSYYTDDLEISENNIFHAIDVGIKIYRSEENLVTDNTIVYVRNTQLVTLDNGFDLGGTNLNPKVTAVGVKIDSVSSTELRRNVVSGVEVGNGFDYFGESCEGADYCQKITVSSKSSDNVAHSVRIGLYSMLDSQSCALFSGFTIHTVHSIAVHFQSNFDTVILDNIKSFDNPMGILPSLLFPDPLSHQMKMKSLTIQNSLIAGQSNSYDCGKYMLYQEMGDFNFDLFKKASPMHPDGYTRREWVGFNDLQCWNEFNRFPEEAIDFISGGGGNPAMYCQTCIFETSFENFDNKCSEDSHWAISSSRGAQDSHGPTRLISGNSFHNTPTDNRVKFLNPLKSYINPSDCVDMSCDKHRRNLIVDEEGVIGGSGKVETYMSHSEFEWNGDPAFGLGDYRIPTTMNNKNGEFIPIDTYAPKKGAVKASDCIFSNISNGYSCGDEREYSYLIMESLDGDTEVRRLSPIGVRSSDGHIDLINGPSDHSCCSGYACQVRISMFKILFACGMEYDIHASSTLPSKIRFHLQDV